MDEEDGSNILYCNARSSLGFRVQALSDDDGTVFQNGQLVHKLLEPRNGCHGSVIGCPAPFHAQLQQNCPGFDLPSENFPRPTWVVYAHPTWPNARRDIGFYLNARPRDPDSWKGPWVIYEGPSAYSDLAYVELGSAESQPMHAFACLFESGKKTAYEDISFCFFTLFELINNLPDLKPHQGAVRPAVQKKEDKKSLCRVCKVL